MSTGASGQRDSALPPAGLPQSSAVVLKPEDGARIWRNGEIPVVFRPAGRDPVLIRLPASAFRFPLRSHDWARWLTDRTNPTDYELSKIPWYPRWKAWGVPRSRFERLVRCTLGRFGSCYVINQYDEMKKCAPACWNAEGVECQCSCLGANHGSQNAGSYYVVSETCAFEWQGRKLSCRLLKIPPAVQAG